MDKDPLYTKTLYEANMLTYSAAVDSFKRRKAWKDYSHLRYMLTCLYIAIVGPSLPDAQDYQDFVNKYYKKHTR